MAGCYYMRGAATICAHLPGMVRVQHRGSIAPGVAPATIRVIMQMNRTAVISSRLLTRAVALMCPIAQPAGLNRMCKWAQRLLPASVLQTVSAVPVVAGAETDVDDEDLA